MYKLVLITNRKLHMGFRYLSKSVTLNDFDRRINALILRYFMNSVALVGTLYVNVVEDRPILSVIKIQSK